MALESDLTRESKEANTARKTDRENMVKENGKRNGIRSLS